MSERYRLPESLTGYRHTHFATLESTNSFLLAQSAMEACDRWWVTAETQTQGKGSRGRSWTGMPGNLFASLLLVDPAPPEKLHELTFVTALAARDTLLALGAEPGRVKLKWPNDVLLDGRKCCGILLEGKSSVKANGIRVVTGIGINCRAAPRDALHKATSLRDAGIAASSADVFHTLSHEMAKGLSIWNGGAAFDVIRRNWLDVAVGIGKTIEVHIPGREKVSGRFVTVCDRGYMVFEREDGAVEEISTADIFFPHSD